MNEKRAHLHTLVLTRCWANMDPLGCANNSAYFTYLVQARVIGFRPRAVSAKI